MSTATATRTVAYPSRWLPAPPPFHLDVPEGLLVHAAPPLLALVRPAEDLPGTPPSTRVRADLVPAGTDPQALVEQQLVQQRGLLGQTHVRTGTHPLGPDRQVRTASLDLRRRGTGTGEVHQLLTVLLAPVTWPGGLTPSLTVVTRWDDEQAPRWAELLRAVHASVRLTRP